MRIVGGAAVAALAAAMATAVWAQDPPKAASAPVADQSTVSYPYSFFAAQQPNTAMDMIMRLPGFTFDDGSSVRGFAGAAGNVLINGQRPASKSDDLNSILIRTPASQVERIDVIRGGAPGIDMQGKAVVANVILKKGAGFNGVIALASTWREEGRNYPELKLEGHWQSADTTTEATLNSSRFYDDGTGDGHHLLRDGTTHALLDSSNQEAHADGVQTTGTAGWGGPLADGKFRVNLMLQDQVYWDYFNDLFVSAGPERQKDFQDKTNGEIGLDWQHSLGAKTTLELIGVQQFQRLGFTSAFDTLSEQDFFDLSTSNGESIGRAVLRWNPDPKLTVEGGGEFAYNWVDSRTLFSVDGVSQPIPAANVHVDEKRGEAFVTTTWRPFAKLTVEAGVRVEDSTIESSGDVTLRKSLIYPKPRLLLTWQPEANDQFRLRVEREVGQLDFNNFVASSSLNGSGVLVGDPNLVPSQDTAFEIAWEHRFWGSAVATLTARHLILKDVTDFKPITQPACSSNPSDPDFTPSCPPGGQPANTFDTPANIGGGSENDLDFAFSIPLDRFFIKNGQLTGHGLWTFSRVTDPTTGETRRISNQRPFNGEAHFAQDLPKWKAKWGVDTFFGWTQTSYRFDEIDEQHLQTYFVGFLEYLDQKRPGVSYRWEFSDLSRRPYEFTRNVFSGVRTVGADPTTIDYTKRNNGIGVRFRVRKNF